MNDEGFGVIGGGPIKSVNDGGLVGGYLVLFDAVDLDKERLTLQSDFWLEGKSSLPLLIVHGLKRVQHVNL